MNLINKTIIEQILKENCNKHVSLKAMKHRYAIINGNANFSLETLRKSLRLVHKLKFRKPQFINCRKTQNRFYLISHLFIKKMIKLLMDNYQFVYIDESSFTNNHKSFRTWVNVYEKTKKFHPGRFKCNNLLLAMTESKIVHFLIKSETTKSVDFLKIFEKLDEKIKEEKSNKKLFEQKETVYFMDNASIHCGKEVMKYIENNSINVIYGIPYSPELNPIELFFFDIKKKFYERIFKSK